MSGLNGLPESKFIEKPDSGLSPVAGVARLPATAPMSDRHVPFLDSMRGIAVLFVFAFHAWHVAGHPLLRSKMPLVHQTVNFTKLIENGWVGVDFFFVLSAFLLSQHWLKADYLGQPRPSLKKYLRHRFFRILPAYYACLFLMLLFLCPILISPSMVYSGSGLKYLGAHLLFLQYLSPTTSASYGINGSLWTLTLEVIFYLILPWAVILFLRNRWLVVMPLLFAANILWLYLTRNRFSPLVDYAQSLVGVTVDEGTIRFYLAHQFPGYLVVFGIGAVLANLFVRYQLGLFSMRATRLLTNVWVGVGCVVCGWLIVFCTMKRIYSANHHGGGILYLWYTRDIIPALGFAVALFGLLFGCQKMRNIFSFSPVRWIGLISYSVYLWHLPLLSLYAKFPEAITSSPGRRFSFIFIYGFIATMLLGIASYFAIEKPFLAFGRRQTPWSSTVKSTFE